MVKGKDINHISRLYYLMVGYRLQCYSDICTCCHTEGVRCSTTHTSYIGWLYFRKVYQSYHKSLNEWRQVVKIQFLKNLLYNPATMQTPLWPPNPETEASTIKQCDSYKRSTLLKSIENLYAIVWLPISDAWSLYQYSSHALQGFYGKSDFVWE